MNDEPDVYVTQALSKEQLRQALEAFPLFVRKHCGNCILQAEYGWGSKIHPELCYKPMSVGAVWLDRFIADSLRQEIVIPGGSDFRFTLPEDRLSILFCHEGDIHSRGSDLEIQKTLWSSEPFSRYVFKKKPSE